MIKTSKLRGALTALAFTTTLLAGSAAFASTAANTYITNTATVNFNDAAGTPQDAVTATAYVTVTLVASAPTLSAPVDQTIAQGTNGTVTYTITGTANGPDTYNVGSVATATNVSGVTPTFPATITLGGTTLATALVGDGTETTITVPYDNNADNESTEVNGIGAGSIIVIGGNPYEVASVTENAGSNTTTVTLTTAVTGGAVAVATIIGEQQTFAVTVPSGTVTSGSSGEHSVVTTVSSGTTPGETSSDTVVVTVNRATLSVTKSVSADNGATFAPSVNAAPGTSLIYKIVVENAGVTDALSVAITDGIPTYLTYVDGSGKFALDDTTAYASATAVTDATDADGYDFDITATNTVTHAAGDLAGGDKYTLFFRATID